MMGLPDFMSVPDPVIAVVIPAYKAEQHLTGVIASISARVQHIVVVEDCSPDRTAEVAAALTDPRIHLVHHTSNQGVGGAMLTGYETAASLGADIMVKMDSDGQMDPAHLPVLLEPLMRGEADYVKGNRFMHLRSLKNMPFKRRIGNIGLSFITKLATGYWSIFDPTNGFTALRTDVYRLLRQENISRRYFFEISMLLELGLVRAVVKDVYLPSRYGSETSSLSEWDALVKFPWKLLAGFLRRIMIEYFIRDFSALSLFLLAGLTGSLFGLVFGISRWYKSFQTGMPTNAGTVMVAVIPFILGIQFLLQTVILDIQNTPRDPIYQAPRETTPSSSPGAGR